MGIGPKRLPLLQPQSMIGRCVYRGVSGSGKTYYSLGLLVLVVAFCTSKPLRAQTPDAFVLSSSMLQAGSRPGKFISRKFRVPHRRSFNPST